MTIISSTETAVFFKHSTISNICESSEKSFKLKHMKIQEIVIDCLKL